MAKQAGRDPAKITISAFGQPADRDLVRRFLDAGATRVIIRPAAAKTEQEMQKALEDIARTVLH